MTRPNRPVPYPQRRITAGHQPRRSTDPHRVRRTRTARVYRHPAVGLPLLVLLGLVALFVSWVSAEPFWMAVGHHDAGAVHVTHCAGQGDLGTRCVGRFSAADREYTVDVASVSGAATADRTVGTTMPARMVSAQGRIAYVGDSAGLHLRWFAGLVLLLVTGFGTAFATGAWRFTSRTRIAAIGAGIALPLHLAAVVLAFSY